MIIGSFNGASILAFPSSPGLKQIQVDMVDTVAAQRSPYTGTTQVQAWPGGDFWTGEITLPQLDGPDASAWTAFLAECRGMLNVFWLGHPLYRQPRGTPDGAPLVNGVNAPMSSVLNTKGWTPNAFDLLRPGDRLQIGYRLHVVLTPVNADADGHAAISIWPSIREATADNDPVILNTPQGLFRLAENKRSVLSTETRLSGVSLKVMEAR